MAKRTARSKEPNSLAGLLDFVEVVDATFERLTGKTIATWLKEFQQRARELPGGEQPAPQEPAMSLASAYAMLGLPPTATMEEVKGNYKRLAAVFHPDKGGYKEAMVLLNNAYEQIMKEKAGVS
ncbi:hypothetical protein ES703_107489 [subsurface metagenome]